MPYFIVEYRSTGGALRSKGDEYKAAQAARKEYRQGLGGTLLLAGAKFATTSDSETIASIMLIEAKDFEAARDIASKDPYFKIGELSDLTVNQIMLTKFNSDFKL